MEIYIQAASAGRGLSWITEALSFFTRNPLGWIGAIIIIFIITMFIGLIPFGTFALNIFYPVIVGGYMLGCKAHHQGGSFELQHVFSGFKEPYFTRLVLVGVIYTVASLIALILFGIMAFVTLGGFELFHQLEQGQMGDIAQHQQDFIVLTLVAVALFTPFLMAMWFAPVIIISSDISPMSALILSFKACLTNIIPFTVYGVVVLILLIIAAIPLMLGYLVLLPVLTASVYIAYLDCFKIDSTNDPTQLLP